MHRYVVITQFTRTLRDQFATDSETGRDILYYYDLVPESLSRGVRNPYQCFYADTQESADSLAKEILRNNPTATVSVAKIETMYTAKKQANVTILTAKYTDQGLVPV